MNSNSAQQNVIHDFLEFSRNFNNTMQQMLRTYNSISESYRMLITNSDQERTSQQRSNMPRNNTRRNGNQTNINVPNTYYYPYSPLYTYPIGGGVTQNRNRRNVQRNNVDNIWNLFNSVNNGFNWNTFMEPVAIIPTRQQIERAIENVTYGTFETEQQHCPIDLIPFEEGEELVRIRHCQHIFRRNNLTGWFSTSYRCPLCRYDIRNYDGAATPNNSDADADSGTNSSDSVDTTDVSGNTETTDPTETDGVTQTILSNGNTFTTTTQNSGNPLQNSTTIQIDTGVVPLNFNINDQTQAHIGNAITDTILQTFQGLLDISGNTYNVDYQYDLFNNGNNTN